MSVNSDLSSGSKEIWVMYVTVGTSTQLTADTADESKLGCERRCYWVSAVCVCVHVYVCVYAYAAHVYMHVYVCTLCTCEQTRVHMCARTCVPIHVRMHVCACASAVLMHVCMHALCVHVCTCVYARVRVSKRVCTSILHPGCHFGSQLSPQTAHSCGCG